MTPFGRAHCIRRLSSAKDLSELAKIWAGLGVFSQNDPAVRAHKDKLKSELNWTWTEESDAELAR